MRKCIKVNRRCIVLPAVRLQPSTIPHGGNGLFVEEDVRKGRFCTEYGGQLITHDAGVRLRATGDDTHVMSISPFYTLFDGRELSEQGPFSREWYHDHHILGSFANDPFNTDNKANAEIVKIDVPGHQTPAGDYITRRILFRATVDIPKGTEILINYGATYHARHF